MLCVTHEMALPAGGEPGGVVHGPGPDHRGQRAGDFLLQPQHERTQAFPEPDFALEPNPVTLEVRGRSPSLEGRTARGNAFGLFIPSRLAAVRLAPQMTELAGVLGNYRSSGLAPFPASIRASICSAETRPASCAACTAMAERR